MKAYKEYEEEVYNWLMSKRNNDNSFTFSLRQNDSKEIDENIKKFR